MEKFTTLTGVAAPMPIVNVDTDMIIPKDYLKTIKRTGLATGLFAEMKLNDDGTENSDLCSTNQHTGTLKFWSRGQFRLRILT